MPNPTEAQDAREPMQIPATATENTTSPAPVRPGASIEPVPRNPLSDELIRKQSGKSTRRAMLVMSAGAVAGAGLLYYLNLDPPHDGQPALLRDTLIANQKITQAITGDRGLAPTYPVEQATDLRYNLSFGCKNVLKPASYRLQLVGVANPKSYRDRYASDVTAWDYQLSDNPADEPAVESFKVDPTKEMHPEARPGQGPDVGATGALGGNLGKPDLVQPTAMQAAAKDKPSPPVPSGGQPPAKSLQQNSSGASLQGQGQMPPKPQDKLMALGNTPGKRRRGQEEAGPSDSGLRPGSPGLLLTMDDIQKLPHQELVTQFKCIEGWSQIVHWGGFRLADLIKAYPPARNPDGSLPRYVYMETPDGDYYCSFDMIDCMHPQSLLVTEMGGKPITQFHGGPLRLHMPIKYGYKQIKRIGLIAYTNDQPDDYWTKLGYDWYAGL